MIVPPSGVRVWLATGATDMRRGMNSLALQVQESLRRDPHAGDLYVFRGKRGDLLKILWHDGLGMSLYANFILHLFQLSVRILVPLYGWPMPDRRGDPIDCSV